MFANDALTLDHFGVRSPEAPLVAIAPPLDNTSNLVAATR
jgi:hypothetical protein